MIKRKKEILEIKKEEISPKISPLELNLYSIHYVIIIVIFKNLKKAPWGRDLKIVELFLLHLPSRYVFYTKSRWINLIHKKKIMQPIWQNLTIVFISFFLNLII